MKKIIALALSIIMAFSVLVVPVSAEQIGEQIQTGVQEVVDDTTFVFEATIGRFIKTIHKIVEFIANIFGIDCPMCAAGDFEFPDFDFDFPEIETPEEPESSDEEMENKDTDNDKVPDYIEELFGSSLEKDDTDGDGISDYIEILKISTDPTLKDSDENDVSDGDEDIDADGLTNIFEISYGTDLTKDDTDYDGLIDGEELNKYNTDPLKYDTDSDGVSDGEEIQLGYDPSVAQAEFTISKSAEDVRDNVTPSVNITLSGNQVESLNIKPVDNEMLFPSTIPGYIGNAYDFSVNGSFEQATISFEYDPALLGSDAEPTIFYFNEEEQELEELETTIDGNIASAKVEHFSTYILIDRKIFHGSLVWEDIWDSEQTYTEAEIILVIDDSGSLGGDYGYDSSTGTFTGGKDPEHKRLEVAREFIDRASNNAKIGLVKFDSSASDIAGGLVECNQEGKDSLKSYLKFTYQTGIFDSRGTTYMYKGIQKALGMFSSNNESTMKAIVVFTDGEAHDTSSHNTVINSAVANNVKIYTVGLGTSSSYFTNYLMPLASNTGGAFYSASDAGQLADIYSNISQKIDIETDSDKDGISDYYEDNMIAFNGLKIILDKNNPDTDSDGLKDGEEVKVELKYNSDKSKAYVKGYLLSDPILEDTDYDGTVDSEDSAPNDNWFGGDLTTDYFDSSFVSMNMDYRWFFADNSVYNNKLSKLSLLFSSVIYSGNSLRLRDSLSTRSTNGKSITDVMTFFGFEKAKTYSLKNRYSDEHLSEVGLGYHNVVYNGKLRTILAVVVRGTNGTISEWTSNFDIGDINTYNNTADWKNPENHKGFDITATRIESIINEYINECSLYDDHLVYWVTGHSRGAGIANIIGANLEDAGKKSFTYTFAAPNTTMASNAENYVSIFNIINSDDFVPCLPISDWGYTRYGKSTSSVSVRNSFENKWEEFTGDWDYNSDTYNMESCVNAIGNILTKNSDPQKACYTYTCDCSYADHKGDKSNDTITITNKGLSEKSQKEAIEKIPSNAKPYCYIKKHSGGLVGGWDFDVCQTPAYLMQLLAAKMGNEISTYRFAVELNIADRYEKAKTAIAAAALSGIEEPHYTESYYIIANNITAAAFK